VQVTEKPVAGSQQRIAKARPWGAGIREHAEKRHIREAGSGADPVYNSTLVTKFVNSMMYEGKKSTAQGIFYTSMKNLEQKGAGPMR